MPLLSECKPCEPVGMGKTIADYLKVEVDRIVAEEAHKAAENVERLVREKTAQIAARVVEKMSVDTLGRELVIRIDFGSALR
jgi:hypothetical protein